MLSEVRIATRALLRWRGGAVVAALTLAVGIGAATALSALVRLMLADLPGIPDLERVGRVYAASQVLGVERSPVALHEFESTLAKASTFSAIGAYAEADAVLGRRDDLRPIVAGHASAAFFQALGVPPAEGRVFSAADVDAPAPVALVSHAIWRRHFAGGRIGFAAIVIDGIERTIVGVMPPEFRYGFVGIGADVWIPLGRPGPDAPAIVAVYGRLREHSTWPAAAAELAALSRKREPWTWRAIPLSDDAGSRATNAYTGMLGPALLVLLIACVNVACLLLGRGVARERDLTVRLALGGTRLRVIRELLTEYLVLALAGGALGAALAAGIVRFLATAFEAAQPALAGRLAADWTLLVVALAVSAAACLIFGVTPALRLSKRNVAAALKGIPTAHRIQIAGYGARDAIVFAEVAAAVGLVVWSAMIFTLFAQLETISFTFPADHVVAMRVPAGDVAAVAARVAEIPGVVRTATSSGALGGGTRVRVVAAGAAPVVMSRVPVGHGFLETLGVPMVRGRAFDPAELQTRARAAILSENAAERIAGGREALGMRLEVAGETDVIVVGIARDAVHYGALSKAGAFAPPEIYVPYEPPMASEAAVLARFAGDPHPALHAVAAAAQSRPGRRPARPVVLSDDVRNRGRDAMAVSVRALAGFALLTLVLAGSGVFAVISQSVAQRTRELGIRLAIGATPGRLFWMVVQREAKLIALAIAVGTLFAVGLTNALFAELVQLNAIVPVLSVNALVLAGGVAALAVIGATWRIVRLEPSAVLRRP